MNLCALLQQQHAVGVQSYWIRYNRRPINSIYEMYTILSDIKNWEIYTNELFYCIKDAIELCWTLRTSCPTNLMLLLLLLLLRKFQFLTWNSLQMLQIQIKIIFTDTDLTFKQVCHKFASMYLVLLESRAAMFVCRRLTTSNSKVTDRARCASPRQEILWAQWLYSVFARLLLY